MVAPKPHPVKSKVIDLSDNSTTVHLGKALLSGIYVNTALSAQACPINDGTTNILSLPASLAAGSQIDCKNRIVDTSIVVDPDDSATGSITVFFIPFKD